MRKPGNLDAALRFWQSKFDSLATEVDELTQRHRSLEDTRDHCRQQTVSEHTSVVASQAMAGQSLMALHRNLLAYDRYDRTAAVQQRALSVQIEEKRGQMLTLKRKLKQVETIKTSAEQAAAMTAQRRLDEDAAYLHLIRRRN
jgi:hypothetical protein